ncbi:amino-acid racemase [candidate division WOR-3 bacterium JGI_Cruoil_03_44_89]|uniref:Amino-acid racemase n=1 Tax=candidate division WOR-3 bacterium JGI_Cruoil_03_44_89 TaxID=1973748 RepID=A0A235BXW1_UNCW3|nr:MAG: amino-acid racemase [candidate division WOR-3 bacterium JGI_Cruoil_03_44_89]
MAFIEMNLVKLRKNYLFLDEIFSSRNIKWAVVTKVLCGNKSYLNEIINLGVKQICDSRLSNLKMIKQLNDTIETIYIKPPSGQNASNVIKYADISVNTELSTIKSLSKMAVKQGIKHKIIIMIEMGELREGVMRNDFLKFYEKIFQLENIEVIGIGANFSCLYGVLPSQDKLIQLSLYEQLIETKFNRTISYVSGGSSVVIPLVLRNVLPKGINHFRVGETLFFGTDVYNDSLIKGMEHNAFKLYAEIIELSEKPVVPTGDLGTNVEGKTFEFKKSDIGQKSYRAIVGLGLLDVDEKHIWASDKNIKFVGASSDMIVIDIKDNPSNYKVGDLLEFNMDYMGLLRLMNSKYIEKRIKND